MGPKWMADKMVPAVDGPKYISPIKDRPFVIVANKWAPQWVVFCIWV